MCLLASEEEKLKERVREMKIYRTLTRPKARPVNIDHIPICGTSSVAAHVQEVTQQ